MIRWWLARLDARRRPWCSWFRPPKHARGYVPHPGARYCPTVRTHETIWSDGRPVASLSYPSDGGPGDVVLFKFPEHDRPSDV